MAIKVKTKWRSRSRDDCLGSGRSGAFMSLQVENRASSRSNQKLVTIRRGAMGPMGSGCRWVYTTKGIMRSI